MKAFMNNGFVCAGVSVALVIGTLVSIFPGFLEPLIKVVGMLALLGSCMYGVYFIERIFGKKKLPERVSKALWNSWKLLMSFCYLAAWILVARMIWRIINGLPLDIYGTTIPLSGLEIASIGATLTLLAACFHKHVAAPSGPDIWASQPRLGSWLVTSAVFFLLVAVTTGGTYIAYYHDNPKVIAEREAWSRINTSSHNY